MSFGLRSALARRSPRASLRAEVPSHSYSHFPAAVAASTHTHTRSSDTWYCASLIGRAWSGSPIDIPTCTFTYLRPRFITMVPCLRVDMDPTAMGVRACGHACILPFGSPACAWCHPHAGRPWLWSRSAAFRVQRRFRAAMASCRGRARVDAWSGHETMTVAAHANDAPCCFDGMPDACWQVDRCMADMCAPSPMDRVGHHACAPACFL